MGDAILFIAVVPVSRSIVSAQEVFVTAKKEKMILKMCMYIFRRRNSKFQIHTKICMIDMRTFL